MALTLRSKLTVMTQLSHF